VPVLKLYALRVERIMLVIAEVDRHKPTMLAITPEPFWSATSVIKTVL